MPLIVRLKDGSTVDVMTQAGADAYLSSGHPLLNVSEIKESRLRKDHRKLTQSMVLFDRVVKHATPSVFDQAVGNIDRRSLVDHLQEVFAELASNEQSLKAGSLARHDQILLRSISIFMSNGQFLSMVMKRACKLLPNISDWLSAYWECNHRCPPPKVGFSILAIIFQGMFSWMEVYKDRLEGFEEEYRELDYLKRIEASGLLLHFLRFAAQPQRDSDLLHTHLYVLDRLIMSPWLLQNKLGDDSATGKMLRELPQEQNEPPNPSVRVRLQNIIHLSDLANLMVEEGDKVNRSCDNTLRRCSNCEKSSFSASFQAALLVCSRCSGKCMILSSG